MSSFFIVRCLIRRLPSTFWSGLLPQKRFQVRKLHVSYNFAIYSQLSVLHRRQIPQTDSSGYIDSDDLTPVIPMDKDQEVYINRRKLAELLQTRFKMTVPQITKIITTEFKFNKIHFRDFKRLIELLVNKGVSNASVVENSWILSMSLNALEEKLYWLEKLHPQDINDFVPLLRISASRLARIAELNRHEEDHIFGRNRIYLIANQLKLEPKNVSKSIAKRLFMLELPLESLISNLNALVKYGVAPENIIKDLWAFRYAPRSVETRLNRAKVAQKDKIMPWMVRCPEPILEKSLNLSRDEKKALGDSNSVVDYLSKRLEFDTEITKAIMNKHPAVYKVRVRKMKQVLDYLLDEAGFTRLEIAQVPRILCHGLETTKKRLKELESYGCRPSSLVIVCKSRTEYNKFLTSWINLKSRIKNSSST